MKRQWPLSGITKSFAEGPEENNERCQSVLLGVFCRVYEEIFVCERTILRRHLRFR
jgi:hypothetical protein